jgi:hypothetical protein
VGKILMFVRYALNIDLQTPVISRMKCNVSGAEGRESVQDSPDSRSWRAASTDFPIQRIKDHPRHDSYTEFLSLPCRVEPKQRIK